MSGEVEVKRREAVFTLTVQTGFALGDCPGAAAQEEGQN